MNPRTTLFGIYKEANIIAQTSSKDRMDEALKKLEEDYLDAVENNDSDSVEEFIEAFLYDSWSYNERNLATIKTAMSRYSQQQIDVDTFSNSFKRMVDRVQEKLQELEVGTVLEEVRGQLRKVVVGEGEEGHRRSGGGEGRGC